MLDKMNKTIIDSDELSELVAERDRLLTDRSVLLNFVDLIANKTKLVGISPPTFDWLINEAIAVKAKIHAS